MRQFLCETVSLLVCLQVWTRLETKTDLCFCVSEGRGVGPRGRETGGPSDQQPPGESGFTGRWGEKHLITTWQVTGSDAACLCVRKTQRGECVNYVTVESVWQWTVECPSPPQQQTGATGFNLAALRDSESLCPDKSCFPVAKTDELAAEQRLDVSAGFHFTALRVRTNNKHSAFDPILLSVLLQCPPQCPPQTLQMAGCP